MPNSQKSFDVQNEELRIYSTALLDRMKLKCLCANILLNILKKLVLKVIDAIRSFYYSSYVH